MEMEYLIGTMIEVPRAALTAGSIAKEADFFCFGTNDLTQMTFGFSRDDTGKMIKEYMDKGILADDPFQTIDQEGVGSLMEHAVKQGKQTRPNIKLGICGEHGGDPRSIEFCHKIDFIMFPARHSVCQLRESQQHKQQSKKKIAD